MFQSEDFDIDEDFLKDAFGDPAILRTSKRHSDESDNNSIKKPCLKPAKPTTTPTFIDRIKSSKLNEMSTKSIIKKFSCPKQPIYTDKNCKVVQRKFPGPAGILPDQKLNNSKTAHDKSVYYKSPNEEIICSQMPSNVSKTGPWMKMLADFYADNIQLSLPEKYTISWLKTQASAKQLLGQKTPFLAAMIHSIDCTHKNPIAVLKDVTGEIHGAIHHEVWDEYGEVLLCGSVIVLKQVGVLTTSKKHYLNITSNNLVTIYNDSDSDEIENSQNEAGNSQRENSTVLATHVQHMTSADIIKSINDIKTKHKSQQSHQRMQPIHSSNNPYFSNHNNSNSPLPINRRINNSTGSNNKFMNRINSSPDVISATSSANLNRRNNIFAQPKNTNQFNFQPKLQNCNSDRALNIFSSLVNESSSDVNLTITDSQGSEIADDVLSGIDADSFFDDF